MNDTPRAPSDEAQGQVSPRTKQQELLDLADRIDHEQLWRWAGMDHHKMTPEQRDRMNAGVALRRYAKLWAPGHWVVFPPVGPVHFSASTLDKAVEMAKRDDSRTVSRHAMQIEAAAKVIAQCMDYPWEHMPEQGRANMRKHAEAVVAALTQPPTVQQAEPEGWRAALQFYADRSHFNIADDEAWDTVSGEPQNFWCDEAGTATVEDGTVAAMALRGTPLRDEDDGQPVARKEGA